ncbi:serine hydrolase [Sphingopyxis sp. MWB1]|uniref:serine hydrolase n=1 Tax=Sphingopyxis sp. MWB1 TaxID=1537715 RepID=UPI00051A0188|nr:serine hydrolase [Sphingopyxis sp. MWB1]
MGQQRFGRASLAAALLGLSIFIASPGTAQTQPSVAEATDKTGKPQDAAAEDSAFERRAAQLVDLFSGRLNYGAYFAPLFQAAVSEAQFEALRANLITAYGEPLAVEAVEPLDPWRGTARLRFARASGTVTMEVSPDGEQRVTGLRIQNFILPGDSFAAVSSEMATLPGKAGFLVAEIDNDDIRPLASLHGDAQFAVGSTYKLYLLGELAAQIAAGEHRWDAVVPLTHQSFSSAATAGWATDTPVTIQTLANWMIAVSDNGAADTLLHLLGRERIEAYMRGTGHEAPSRNIPMLSTVEAFALKGVNFASERRAFIAADDAAQRQMVEGWADRLTLANVDGVSFAGKPRYIDALEWFASPRDIAQAMAALRSQGAPEAMQALAINNGVGPEAAKGWRYLGYKGGSELGVMSMTLLGQREADGKWFVVTASWNNPDADTAAVTMIGLVGRLLQLALKAD